jgi:hypothetical protein
MLMYLTWKFESTAVPRAPPRASMDKAMLEAAIPMTWEFVKYATRIITMLNPDHEITCAIFSDEGLL